MSSNHISQKKRSVLFVTRPLSPPWDEASKNFAYDLACNATDMTITILVDKIMDDVPKHIIQKRIYSTNHFSLSQKVRLVYHLFCHASEYDIIHLLFTPTKINSTILKFMLKKKGVHILQTIATVRDDLYTTDELKKMYFGDTLVTYSQWAQKKLVEMGLKNTHHIYPGINLTKYTPTPKNLSLLQQWHLTADHTIITYPGEFVRLGATDMIVDAFCEIWQDPANAHIRYICACRIKNADDAQKKNEVIKKFTAAGHIDKVVFTDTFSDMNAIYNLSDIVIFPVTNMRGKFDVPLAMIEPYACKKPVIASDLPLFREFSSSRINVIIPRAQKAALAQAILSLAKDPVRQKEYGEQAYIFAHNTFNIHTITQHYENLYKQTSQQDRKD